MDNRCSSCGYVNEPYAPKCSKCGVSFQESLNEKKGSMNDFRLFSILYLITSLVGTGNLIYRYVVMRQFTYGIFSGVPSFNSQQVQNIVTPMLYLAEIIAAISAIVTLISIIYLRRGFKTLSKRDNNFNTSVTGTTLIFAGLIMVVVALLVLVSLLVTALPGLLQPTPTFNTGSLAGIAGAGLLILAGGVVLIVGVIMGIILGLHKLSVKFDESMFEVSWILYLVSFFFSPLGIVAAYFSYAGTNRTSKRIDESLTAA